MSRINIVSAKYAAMVIKKAYPYKELSIHPSHVNENGMHITLLEQNTGKRYHVKFARQVFKKFGVFFPEYSGEEGESIDKSVIDKLDDDDVVFFARPEAINRIFVGDLKDKAFLRTNVSEGVETYSIAISDLEVL